MLLLVVDLGDHNISGVGDNGAEHTGSVTSNERNTSLGKLGVLILGLGQVRVDQINKVLKSGKLDHGVRDLTSPKRGQTAVQTRETLSGEGLAGGRENVAGERRDGGLGLDLDGLPGAQHDVGEELGRGRGGQEEHGLVLGGNVLADPVAVLVLEQLVQTVLTSTLERVTDQGGAETGEDTTEALGLDDGLPGLEVVLVQ